MACSILAVNFVDQNNNLFPTCQVTSGTTVKVEVRFTMNASTNAFMYYILDTPNGRTSYWSSMKTFIVPSGTNPTFTQYLTSTEGFNPTVPGNYTVYAAQVIDENKTYAICSVIDPLQSCMTLVVGGQQTLGSISIQPGSISINAGATTTLSASCKDIYNNSMTCSSLTWVSNNTSIATVSNGTITGMSPGTTTIIASSSGIISNTCQVTVSAISKTYQCISNVCQESPCTIGTLECYQTSNCDGMCIIPPPTGCSGCNLNINYCISGSCIPKNYVLLGAVGFFALMMLR